MFCIGARSYPILITTFVFLVIRWMHHKGTGQLSMHELIILIGLGSAIGEPMISTQEMTLHRAFTAIIIVVASFKLIDYLTIKSKRFQKFTEQDPTLLVKDGKYIEEGFKKARVTKGNSSSYAYQWHKGRIRSRRVISRNHRTNKFHKEGKEASKNLTYNKKTKSRTNGAVQGAPAAIDIPSWFAIVEDKQKRATIFLELAHQPNLSCLQSNQQA